MKGAKGYWNKIRVDFPEAFERMVKQERKMNVKILDVFLDELEPSAGNYHSEFETECGVVCAAFPTPRAADGAKAGSEKTVVAKFSKGKLVSECVISPRR